MTPEKLLYELHNPDKTNGEKLELIDQFKREILSDIEFVTCPCCDVQDEYIRCYKCDHADHIQKFLNPTSHE